MQASFLLYIVCSETVLIGCKLNFDLFSKVSDNGSCYGLSKYWIECNCMVELNCFRKYESFSNNLLWNCLVPLKRKVLGRIKIHLRNYWSEDWFNWISARLLLNIDIQLDERLNRNFPVIRNKVFLIVWVVIVYVGLLRSHPASELPSGNKNCYHLVTSKIFFGNCQHPYNDWKFAQWKLLKHLNEIWKCGQLAI